MAECDFDVKVAVIGKAHGLKGCVKLYLFFESLEDLDQFNELMFDKNDRKYDIKIVLKKKDHYIVKISGVDSREQAEVLKGIELFVKRSVLPNTLANEFYHVDLIGMEVLSEDNTRVGTVINVMNFGAGDLLEIQQVTNNNSIYHPFNQDFIIVVDNIYKKIVIKDYK